MKIWKWTKRGLLVATATGVLGFVVLGTQFPSYVTSACGFVSDQVKENVPVELEIKRGRDLLAKLGPEIRKDVKQLAYDEVEVDRLARAVDAHDARVGKERAKLAKVRSLLDTEKTSYISISGREFSRQEVLVELERSHQRLQDAEEVLTSKKRHLDARRAALAANIKKLSTKRKLKDQLAAKIDTLESEHSRLKAEVEGSGSSIDTSSVAQVQNLIGDLEKRLEVTRKVMEHEARFPEGLPLDEIVDEKSVLDKIDSYLEDKTPTDDSRI